MIFLETTDSTPRKTTNLLGTNTFKYFDDKITDHLLVFHLQFSCLSRKFLLYVHLIYYYLRIAYKMFADFRFSRFIFPSFNFLGCVSYNFFDTPLSKDAFFSRFL